MPLAWHASSSTRRGCSIVGIAMLYILMATSVASDQAKPEWCRARPRPEYKNLERVAVSDSWFEVYRVAPSVYAIYEPHQSEETISYLISGTVASLLFDTGMGIGDLKKVVGELTQLPVVVLNSHTHNDHVGDNWQFEKVYAIDTDFTRQNARGSREDAQAELEPGQICGNLPAGFDAKAYATKPWKITRYLHDRELIELGERKLEVIATPGHTPDAVSLFDRNNGLLFTGDTYYPARIWLFRPETDLTAYDASIRRLSALAPKVKVVLGAHNIPVADPSVLPRLVTAFEKVRSGKVTAIPESAGKVTYKVDGFAFLMRAPENQQWG
jgi:glyoxylase-like metal-dependent hydrolase (beta-lactamase superfamily II)